MKTIQQFLIDKEIKSNLDPVNIPQVKEWMKEYSELLLEHVVEKANILLKEVYSESYAIKEDTIIRWHSNGTRNVYPDDTYLYHA